MKTIDLHEQHSAPAKAWDLEKIVKKASLLDERLEFLHESAPAEPQSPGQSKLLNEWMGAAAQGDAAMFQKRLGWDNITSARAEVLVSDFSDRLEHKLPAWASTLNDVLELAAEIQDTSITGLERWAGVSEPNEPIAFEHLLLPFV